VYLSVKQLLAQCGGMCALLQYFADFNAARSRLGNGYNTQGKIA